MLLKCSQSVRSNVQDSQGAFDEKKKMKWDNQIQLLSLNWACSVLFCIYSSVRVLGSDKNEKLIPKHGETFQATASFQ